jgi:hypothetical protein
MKHVEQLVKERRFVNNFFTKGFEGTVNWWQNFKIIGAFPYPRERSIIIVYSFK